VLGRLERIMRIAVALLLVCSTAQAEFFTGNDLLAKMESDHIVDRSMALGYVVGVSDTGDGVTHCPPANITTGQVRDLVKGHLTRNPGSRHFSADSLITNLLRTTWPCKPSGRGI
jgi:hypothetical protein